MKLFIIRHGETAYNKKGIIQGHIDTSLARTGKEQAKKLAEKLIRFNIDVVYCSDLKRCKQTIEPFLKIKKNIHIYYTKELRERNFGIFEGKRGEKMKEWIKNERNNDYNTKLPGGESFVDVKNRLSKFFKKLFKKEKGKNVLLSTHGLTKKALLTYLFNKNKKDYRKIRVPNTALSIVNIKDDGNHRAILLNSVSHL